MPNVCTIVYEMYGMALETISPADGSPHCLPALLNADELEEYKELTIDEADDFYGDTDPDGDGEYTRLQSLFEDILKAFLKNPKEKENARKFIDEKVICATLSVICEDA